jgi:hypothetical protein
VANCVEKVINPERFKALPPLLKKKLLLSRSG